MRRSTEVTASPLVDCGGSCPPHEVSFDILLLSCELCLLSLPTVYTLGWTVSDLVAILDEGASLGEGPGLRVVCLDVSFLALRGGGSLSLVSLGLPSAPPHLPFPECLCTGSVAHTSAHSLPGYGLVVSTIN